MKTENKTTLTTEPAIAVEPVLAVVDFYPYTHIWLENNQSFKKSAISMNISIGSFTNKIRRELVRIGQQAKSDKYYYWCRIAKQREKRQELMKDLLFLRNKNKENEIFINNNLPKTWIEFENYLFTAYVTGQNDIINKNNGLERRPFHDWLNENFVPSDNNR